MKVMHDLHMSLNLLELHMSLIQILYEAHMRVKLFEAHMSLIQTGFVSLEDSCN
jgi:hypothetical protein